MPIHRRALDWARCLAILGLCAPLACGALREPLDTDRLTRRIEALENELARVPQPLRRPLVESFARELAGRRLRIDAATVMIVYRRDPPWKNRPYFSVAAFPEDRVELSDIAPDLRESIATHLWWASAAEMVRGRQLMFELAVDEATHQKLEAGCRLTTECDLLGVIRGGRSVYCRVPEGEEVRCSPRE